MAGRTMRRTMRAAIYPFVLDMGGTGHVWMMGRMTGRIDGWIKGNLHNVLYYIRLHTYLLCFPNVLRQQVSTSPNPKKKPWSLFLIRRCTWGVSKENCSRQVSVKKSMPGRKATQGNHSVKQKAIHMFDLNVNFLGLQLSLAIFA